MKVILSVPLLIGGTLAAVLPESTLVENDGREEVRNHTETGDIRGTRSESAEPAVRAVRGKVCPALGPTGGFVAPANPNIIGVFVFVNSVTAGTCDEKCAPAEPCKYDFVVVIQTVAVPPPGNVCQKHLCTPPGGVPVTTCKAVGVLLPGPPPTYGVIFPFIFKIPCDTKCFATYFTVWGVIISPDFYRIDLECKKCE